MVTLPVKRWKLMQPVFEKIALAQHTSVAELLNVRFDWSDFRKPNYCIFLYFNDPEEELVFRLTHGV